MATVNFLYRSTKDESTLILRLLYRLNKKDYVYGAKTKYKVTKHYWSKHIQSRPKDIEVINKKIEVNKDLNKIANHVLKSFELAKHDEINKKWLQKQIKLYYNPKKETSALPKELLKYFDRFLKYKETEITKSSIKKYSVVRNLLEKYEISLDKPLYIIDVNAAFKKDFEDYCLRNQYAPNTIAWALRSIKTVCNHARYHGLETNIQLDGIKYKSKKVDNIYLNFDELELIQNIEDKELSESLLNARDWLIISCYTGQRISDFMRFEKSQIRTEKNKENKDVHLIEFTQQKTDKIMTVALHEKVLEILNKRKGNFPRSISSQKYNDYVKKVCKIAKLTDKVTGTKRIETNVDSKFPYRNETGIYEKWELVTSHIGRRSFATNFYGKIPTSLLIYATGHSTEQMFLKYIGKSNKDLAMELTNYF